MFPPFHTLVLLCVLLISSPLTTRSCFAATANGGSLNAGQELAAGNKLVSRNGKFALGFFRPTGSGITSESTNITTSSSVITPGWYLGIWFYKIPVFTTVWVANRESPITDLQLNRTELKISADCKLVITLKNNAAGTTESLIWSTNHTVNSTTQRIINSTCTGLLKDDGNLVLVAGSPSTNNDVLWQSFDYPTDVGLPGAKLGRNKVTGLNYRYISKKSLVNPGLGAYYGVLETNGVAALRYRHHPSVEYWSSAIPPDKLIPVLKTLLDMDPRTKGLIDITYVDNNDEQYFTYTSLDKLSSTFISVDVSGQLKLNVWSPSGQSWQTIYAIPPDPCSVYAICGAFSICNGKSSPLYCGCMNSFYPKSPHNWEIGDTARGCLRNTSLDCASKKSIKSTDEFLTLAHVTLPPDPQIIEDVNTQSDCAGACLSDCSCTAYSYDNNSRCSVWHGDLLNVKQNDGLDNDSEDVIYIRLAAEDFRILRKNKRKSTAIVTITVASTISFGLLILMILMLIWRYKYKGRGVLLHSQGSRGGIIAFRYTDLCQATKNFSEKLGGGGFGSVFKGVLCDMTTIAVKRLDGACQGEKQFRAEVSSIGLIQHINLVKLIGFCCQGDKRLLVYEHVLNGSLDAHLFQSNSTALNWSTRYQIATGVARGLYYLHHSCRECIIHCDIKPQNILLDASFIPKIADFGMSVFVGRGFSRILTTFRGTLGYLAPEWLSGVAITPKIDVYSFGMVLLELISGRRNLSEVYTSNSVHTAYFPMQAINKLREGDVHSLVDPQLQGDFNLEEAEKICKVACWCIQDNESDRPTMAEVVRILEGLQELDIPPMPRLLAAITEGSTEASM